jgi:hypothetical protein
MTPTLGKIEGRGEIRGPDGKLKAEFIISGEGTLDAAESFAQSAGITLTQEIDNGRNPSHRSS